MYTSTMQICIHNRGMYEQYRRIDILIRYYFMNLVLNKGGQNESSSWL